MNIQQKLSCDLSDQFSIKVADTYVSTFTVTNSDFNWNNSKFNPDKLFQKLNVYHACTAAIRYLNNMQPRGKFNDIDPNNRPIFNLQELRINLLQLTYVLVFNSDDYTGSVTVQSNWNGSLAMNTFDKEL